MRSPRIPILAALLAPGLVVAERSAEDWWKELGQTYQEGGSFRATYRATSPGKPEARIVIAEHRESGGALTRLEVGEMRTAFWTVPGRKKRFYQMRNGETREIIGYHELLVQMHRAARIFNEKELPADAKAEPPIPPTSAHGHLTRESLVISLGLHVGGPPWFPRSLMEEATSVKVEKEEVRFALPDGDWVVADRKTGRLLEQASTGENGQRTLELTEVVALDDREAFLEACPELPAKVERIEVARADAGRALNRELIAKVAEAARLVGAEPGDLDTFLKERHRFLVDYWKAALADRLPAGFPPETGKSFRDKMVKKLADEFARKHPDKPRPTPEQFFALAGDPFVKGLVKALNQVVDRVPSMRDMKVFIASQCLALGKEERERATVLAQHLYQAYLEAVALIIIDQARIADLD